MIENPKFNQYWYSPSTVSVLLDEVESLGGRAAFLSTPSLFSAAVARSLPCDLFDFDPSLSALAEGDSRFLLFDFNCPITDPAPLLLGGGYSVIVADPPFISEPVWRLYGETINRIRSPSRSRVILTTVRENRGILAEIFGGEIFQHKFQPSIPSLVYQYEVFTDYRDSVHLSLLNQEIISTEV